MLFRSPIEKRLDGPRDIILKPRATDLYAVIENPDSEKEVEVEIPRGKYHKIKDVELIDSESGRDRYIKRRFTLTTKIKEEDEIEHLWISLPLENPNQRVLSVEFNIEPDFKTEVNRYEGAGYAYFHEPEEDVVMDLVLEHRIYGPYKQEDIDREKYLKPEERIESEDKQIKRKAREVTKGEGENIEKAKKIFEFVIDYMDYPEDWDKWVEEKEPTWGAKEALEEGKGDCGSQSNLFIAMCRAVDIPAKSVMGMWGITGEEQFHAWTEFYNDDTQEWVPVDPAAAQDLEMKGFEFIEEFRMPFTTEESSKVVCGDGEIEIPYLQGPWALCEDPEKEKYSIWDSEIFGPGVNSIGRGLIPE